MMWYVDNLRGAELLAYICPELTQGFSDPALGTGANVRALCRMLVPTLLKGPPYLRSESTAFVGFLWSLSASMF